MFFKRAKAPPKIGIQENIWEHHLDLDILNFAKVKVKEFRCPLNTSDDHLPTVTATFRSAKTKPIEAKGGRFWRKRTSRAPMVSSLGKAAWPVALEERKKIRGISRTPV